MIPRGLTIGSSAANEVSPLQRRVRQRWSWLERVVVRGHDARLSNEPETKDWPRTVELWSVSHAKRATGPSPVGASRGDGSCESRSSVA